MTLLYNIALFFWLLFSSPWIVWHYCYHKKYRGSLLARLGFSLEKLTRPKEDKVIWIHAVSLGEMKSSLPLIQKYRKEYPSVEIYFSTTTETAQRQAATYLKGAIDHLFYLPIDFSWIVRRYVKRLRPNLFILIETDFWPNLMKEIKKMGGQVAVASGKMSEKSFLRLKRFPFIAKWLLKNIDVICLQSDSYRERFLKLGFPETRLFVTGNLKYDAMPAPKVLLENALPTRRFITFASTHEGEESGLLKALETLPADICFFVVPRHPERFGRVEEYLKQSGITFDKFTEMKEGLNGATKRVVFINTMGELDKCYALSQVVIVGGSFVPGIGGHNIYEPMRFHKSVLFGPFMHNQEELVKDALRHKAAEQTDLDHVKEVVEKVLKEPISRHQLDEFELYVKGAVVKTFTKIHAFCS